MALLFASFGYMAIISIFGTIVILIIFAYNDIKKLPKKTFMSLVLSLTAPTLVIYDDSSNFFIKTGLLVNASYLLVTGGIFAVITGTNFLDKFRTKTIFECMDHPDYDSLMRCQYSNGKFSNCVEMGFWTIPENPANDFVTVCSLKWTYLFIFSCTITGLLITGSIGLYFMHCFLNPVTKMRFFKKLTCSKLLLWDENNRLWLPYVNELRDGANFWDLNDKAIEKIGAPLLDVFVEHRHHSLVKVRYS